MGNILDKKDRALVNTPTGGEAKKTDVYKWSETSEPGEFILIDKNKLNLDSDYQRECSSKSKVLSIARSWDWKLCGAISVVIRNDNTYWVYDGGHRTRAAFYRSDIKELPCMVFKSESIRTEAKAFWGTNKIKSNVSSYDSFRASITAEEPIALKAKSMLDEHGYFVSNNSKKKKSMRAIGTLLWAIEENESLAKKTLEICVYIADEGPILVQVFGGLFMAGKRSKDTDWMHSDRTIEKLSTAGMEGLNALINKQKIIESKGGKDVEARGILSYLNKGVMKKNRIQLV